jgi:hypothetical protein
MAAQLGFTNAAETPRAEIVKGPRDQFLFCRRFAINEDCRVSEADGFFENALPYSALPNDLPKIHFSANFEFHPELPRRFCLAGRLVPP